MKTRAGLLIACCVAMALWLWLGSALQPSHSPLDEKSPAQRVVCLDPGVTEVVLRLGAASLLVARPNHTDEFQAIAELPAVGTGITPNYEDIVRAGPDLILTTGTRGTVFNDLSSIAPTRSLPWLTIADVAAGIRTVGAALGRSEAAEQLARDVKQGLQDRTTTDSPTVLLLIGAPSEARPDLWYIKDNSLHGAALRAAGGHNAVARSTKGTASLSVERLLEIDPEVVVMMIANPGANSETLAQHRSFWDRLSQLSAVQNKRIHFLVGGEHFYTGPGILNLVKALQESIQGGSGGTL
jgi:ABC-type Fe3+-hydroxamate transport system substrate-binding protein